VVLLEQGTKKSGKANTSVSHKATENIRNTGGILFSALAAIHTLAANKHALVTETSSADRNSLFTVLLRRQLLSCLLFPCNQKLQAGRIILLPLIAGIFFPGRYNMDYFRLHRRAKAMQDLHILFPEQHTGVSFLEPF